MPELPEAETVARALRHAVQGRRFTLIETFIPALRLPLDLAGRPELIGRKIGDVRRRGRYIIIELDNLEALVVHLGMTGSFRTAPPGEPRRKHEHVIFHLDNGTTLRFECPRRFSFIVRCRLAAPGAEPAMLSKLGPEPFASCFTGAYLKEAFRRRSAKVKTMLMDNAVVAGIGNIYAAEALFLSGIRPTRAAGSLTGRECDSLAAAAVAVLRRAIAAGGTTISDYRQLDGSTGRFASELKIYGKTGQPCPVCGTAVKRTVIGGRGSFFCPRCQK